MLEFRDTLGEFRADPTDPDGRTFSARVCNYNVPDAHKTSWAPGVFTDSLRAKLPKSVWSHDWSRPIGKVIGYEDSPEGLDVKVKLADFETVPDARMAHSMLKDGIVDNFSFGFVRQSDEADKDHKGVTRITKARIDEVSPVLVGSVPGTRTLAVRSGEHFPEVRMFSRTPHTFTEADGACARCGGKDVDAVHERAATAVELRDLATRIAVEPVAETDSAELIAAADIALDAAIALAQDLDVSRADPAVGRIVALVLSADAHLDAAMDALSIPDEERDVRTAFVAPEPLPPAAPDGFEDRIGSLGRGRRGFVATPKA